MIGGKATAISEPHFAASLAPWPVLWLSHRASW